MSVLVPTAEELITLKADLVNAAFVSAQKDAEHDQRLAQLNTRVALLEQTDPGPVDPGPVDPPPSGDGYGTLLKPFAKTSPWNTKIPASARYQSPTDGRTSTLRNGGGTSWMNIDQYSMEVYEGTVNDPLVTLSDPVHGKSVKIRIPSDATPAKGTDANMAVLQPDGVVYDIWQFARTGGSTATCNRYEDTRIDGSGLGPLSGIRASAVSSLGGLIKKWEVAAGRIEHALAMSVQPGMLYYSGGNPGWDGQGYGTALGYLRPDQGGVATEQDYSSPWVYSKSTSALQMGCRVAIPRSVDITKLGLNAEALVIAGTMQDYGGFIVDMAGSFNWYAEPELAGTTWDQNIRGQGSNWGVNTLAKIRSQLVVVSTV